MERIVNAMEESPNRENILEVWKHSTIEDDIILAKAVKVVKLETIHSC